MRSERARPSRALTLTARESEPERVSALVDGRVSRAVTGTFAVQRARLAAKLGRGVLMIYAWAQKRRHATTGEAVFSAPEVARALNVPRGTVNDAFARLGKAGLFEAVGWRVVNRRYVYVRRVLGFVHPDADITLCAVPARTAKWVDTAYAWGGARTGAGGLRFPAGGRPKSKPASPVAKPSRPVGVNQQDQYASLRSLSLPFSPSDEGEKPAAAGPTLRGTTRKKRGVTADVGLVVEAPAPPALSVLPPEAPLPDEGDAVLGTVPDRLPTPLLQLDVPDLGQLGGVVVPEPPLLNPEDTRERHAFLLSSWFTEGLHHAYGKRPWVFGRCAITDHKYFPMLCLAARAFQAHAIPPAAWIAFSIDVWRQHNTSDFPPATWVFSAKRIEERRAWFRQECTAYLGKDVSLSPSARALAVLRDRLMRALREEFVETDAHARRVVDRYLPEERCAHLQARARQETRDLNADLRRRMHLGKWVWR